jgi:hypothetical protein
VGKRPAALGSQSCRRFGRVIGPPGAIGRSWGILERYFGPIYPQNGYDPGMKLLIAVIGLGELALICLRAWAIHIHAALATR